MSGNVRRLFEVVFLLCLFIFGSWGIVRADEAGSQTSASVEIGALWISTSDQLMTFADARAESLAGNHGSKTSYQPIVLFDLRHKFNGSGVEAYLTTPFDNSFGISLGSKSELGDGRGCLDVSAFTSLFDAVWKNPYVTGVKRKDTSRQEAGVKLEYSDILGTGFGIGYSLARIDIGDDAAKEAYKALGREGRHHSVSVGRTMMFGEGFMVTPGFQYEIFDLGGGAESSRAVSARLAVMKMVDRLFLQAFLNYSRTSFDDIHPVFGRKRSEENAGGVLMARYHGVLGLPGTYASLIFVAQARYSDIDFFDSVTYVGAMTLGYSF